MHTDLTTLCTDFWDHECAADPLWASYAGRCQFDDRLPDLSPQFLFASYNIRCKLWQRSEQLHNENLRTGMLNAEENISLKILRFHLQNAINDYELCGHYLAIGSDQGAHVQLGRLPGLGRLNCREDYQRLWQRLSAIPRYLQQQQELLREGIKTGITAPQQSLIGIEDSFANYLQGSVKDSLFFSPLKNFPNSVNASAREYFHTRFHQLISEQIRPAIEQFNQFIVNEYRPACHHGNGLCALEKGEALYQHFIRRHVTTSHSAAEIHAIGLQEVERIQHDMQLTMIAAGHTGDRSSFLQSLRTDPRFYVDTPEALLKEASWLAKKIEGELPRFFHQLPRLPYTIKATPAHLAPRYPGGFYREPPAGGFVAGEFWVNTSALDSRPLYTLPALTLHEAMPGHHLQIALAQELQHLPEFRRSLAITAYEEGWALYCEQLGEDLHCYRDPYTRFGKLCYEMWRACRLVIDTGLHSYHWTAQQARDYLAENTALSLREIRTEVDRYMSWPGQALGYKMGEIALLRLREEIQKELGDHFDIRQFHSAILGSGEMPISVLIQHVRNTLLAEQPNCTGSFLMV